MHPFPVWFVMLGPILRGERVVLAPVVPDDLALINAWWALPEVNRFWPGVGTPSMRQTEDWYDRSARSPDTVIWSVRVEEHTVGHTFLAISWQHRRATSGLLLGDTGLWGQGHGTEAVRLRTRYAFDELGLQRLESESVEGNVGMHRALERSGYHAIGRKRRVFYRGGVWHDSVLFELLHDEWRGR